MMKQTDQTAIRLAVVREAKGPFLLEDGSIGAVTGDEVLVRIVATGMCHTDMVIRDQVYPLPLPIVLGHEGAGIVEAVGANVTKVVPGDHVVLTFMSCGACRPCQSGIAAACERFNDLNFAGARPDGSHALCDHAGHALSDRFFAQSSFATHAIAHHRSLVKVRKDAPLDLLGPLGCGIQTGAGTVLNTLKMGAGASFAAFGGGAVGLSAVMAARVAGATTIIAVDVVPERLTLALELGATHVVNSAKEDPVAAILAICPDGVDYAIDSTARPDVIANAVAALRARGTCVIVGAAKPGTQLVADMNDVMQKGKIIRGAVEGDSVPDIFIPQMIDLFMQGRFPFDRLVRFYPFDQINEAAHDSERGVTLKPVIRIGEPAA
jgi:aryl-alcohol dehydrogenase